MSDEYLTESEIDTFAAMLLAADRATVGALPMTPADAAALERIRRQIADEEAERRLAATIARNQAELARRREEVRRRSETSTLYRVWRYLWAGEVLP